MTATDLRERVLAFMERHRLRRPAMALHCEISASTLKDFLAGRCETPRAREQLEAALKRKPAPHLPKHGEFIRDRWNRMSPAKIAAALSRDLQRPISRQRVNAIAKKMGLPARSSGAPDAAAAE